MKFDIWSIFRKSVEKIQVSLTSDKINIYFTRIPMYIFDTMSPNSSYNEKCSVTFVEEIKTHFMLNDSPPENPAVCEVMWKYMGGPGRPRMTILIRYMRFASWVTKTTDRH
jgi:hypothetical protein